MFTNTVHEHEHEHEHVSKNWPSKNWIQRGLQEINMFKKGQIQSELSGVQSEHSCGPFLNMLISFFLDIHWYSLMDIHQWILKNWISKNLICWPHMAIEGGYFDLLGLAISIHWDWLFRSIGIGCSRLPIAPSTPSTPSTLSTPSNRKSGTPNPNGSK